MSTLFDKKTQKIKPAKEENENQEQKEKSEYEKNLEKFFEGFNFNEKKWLVDCHFEIMSETLGFTKFFDFNLLHKILHVRRQGILYADISEVIKRNGFNPEKDSKTDLYRMFEPFDMFILQAQAIKQNRDERIMSNKKEIYQQIFIDINKEDYKKNIKELF